ncbi:MAG: metallophosphoesterase [Clostridia bacterium]|nr:metallophosphoesterase [Clostridia bacterium]
MFREIKSFVLHNTFKAFISAENAVKSMGGGKLVKNIFDVEPKYVGSSVRILKETDDTTYIAKYDAKGRIDNGNFKIMVTTDLHLWNEKDLINKSLDMLAKHIAAEKPDLLLITGDAILTDFQQLDCIQFGRFMEKTGVYWAYCFGNHEARAEKEFHKYFMLKNIESFPHCLSKFGDPELFGYGNFKINIMNSDNKIKQSIFMFDSGRDMEPEHNKAHGLPADMKGYDFIKKTQIDWYKNSIKELEEEHGKFKSMVLMHIPIKEYEEVFDFVEGGESVPTGKAEILYGGMYESVGSSPYNSGLFDAILELGSTNAVFAGHDHVNDFCALYKGVYLVYAQCNGYNTYTMGEKFGWPEKDWIQGVTMVNVSGDGSLTFRQRFNRDYL